MDNPETQGTLGKTKQNRTKTKTQNEKDEQQ
jgi:hypothetical protein